MALACAVCYPEICCLEKNWPEKSRLYAAYRLGCVDHNKNLHITPLFIFLSDGKFEFIV